MTDIFLSYAREDIAKAEAIARALELEGWSVWWDRTIPAGKDFDQVIEEAIDNAKCVVVLWSAVSVASRWVKTEAAEGANRQVLMPVLIEVAKIPLEFRRIQAADLSGWDERPDAPVFRKLIKDVAAILETATFRERSGRSEHKLEVEDRATEQLDIDEQTARTDAEDQYALNEASPYVEIGTDESSTEPPKTSTALGQELPERSQNVAAAAPSTAQTLSGGAADSTYSSEQPQVAGTIVEQRESWWLVFLLPLLGVSISLGVFSLSFQYFAIPLAAWIGHRFPRRGVYTMAVGLLPILYGSPSFSGFRLELAPYLYVTSLVVCWGFSNPNRWWRALREIDVTIPLILCIFVFGASELLFSGPLGQLGWRGNVVLIAVGAFVFGLTGKRSRAIVAVACACAIAGLAMRGWGYSEDFGGGFRFRVGYFFDSFAELLFVLVLLGFGRTMWTSAHAPQARSLPDLRVCVVLALLWLAATHSLSIKANGTQIALLGGPWFIVSVAFIAGTLWQQRGMVAAGVALLFSVVEWVGAVSLLDGAGIRSTFPISESESVSRYFSLLLQFPEVHRHVGAYLAALPLCYLGMRLARGLGFARGLQMQQSFAEKWSADSGAQTERSGREINPRAALAFIPLVALLSLSYQLSKSFTFHFEYLVIPISIWLASRYGHMGFIAFAVGAVTYWIGYSFGPFQFRLYTGLYLVGLLVAWVASHPDHFAKTIYLRRPSYLTTFLIVVLLPASVTFSNPPLEIGWQTYVLFPFAVLLLGWAGVPPLRVVPHIAAMGLATYVLGRSISVGPVHLHYALYSISGLISTTLWYLAGMALRYVFLESSLSDSSGQRRESAIALEKRSRSWGQVIGTWLGSGGGFVGLGVLMLIAPVRIAVSGVSLVSGWTLLLALGAYMAGVLWTWRGLHLTAAVVAVLCLVPPYSYAWNVGPLDIQIGLPPPSFFMIALPALLYTVVGMRMATMLHK